jgi:hypothetical protein
MIYTMERARALVDAHRIGNSLRSEDSDLVDTVQALDDYKCELEHFMDRASTYEKRMAQARGLIRLAEAELRKGKAIGSRLHFARKLLDGRRTRYVYKGKRA